MSETTETQRRKPGRPPTPVQAEPPTDPKWSTARDGFVPQGTETPSAPPSSPARAARSEDVKSQRRRRQGMGAERNLKLHVPEDAKDPNFVYRWVNDRPGRIRQLTTMDDYEVVSASELNGGDPDPMNNTAEGTVVKRTADSRIGEGAVLLKKPKEYYNADKKEEAKVLDARDDALRSGPPASQEGLTGKDGAYVPGGRNIVGGR